MKGQKLIPLLVVAAGLLAYHNSLTGPFIFDDEWSIQENLTIRHVWPVWEALSPPHGGGITVEGRPLVNFSLAVNYALGGYQVWGYHALNLVVHILAGLTLLGIVRRTLRQPALSGRFGVAANGLALAVAILWTVHPLLTESVTYVVQRAESMMGLFYLLTLYCFIRGAESPRPRPWYGLCLIVCALGMASKEVMASAPLVVLLYDRAFVSGSFREAWRRRGPLYLALAGTWLLLGYLLIFTGSLNNEFVAVRSRGLNWWAYLLTEPGVILHYLRLSVWPHPLCFDYYGWPTASTWKSILPSALVLAILLGASAWAWKTNPGWGFLGAWFFLILAPSSSVIPLDSPAFEHRMYLPLAAVVATMTVGAFVVGRDFLSTRLQTRRMLEWLVSGALVLLLVILTIQRNHDYRSELAIWQDTVTKFPNNPRAQNNLGRELLGLGKVPEAIRHLEQALRLKPDYAQAHNNLGVAWGQSGGAQQAIEHFEQALRIDPDFAKAHCNLGFALSQLGKMPAAIGHYEQALRLKLDNVETHYNLGLALQQTGRVREAIGQYEQALRNKPDYPGAQNNLAWLLATLAPTDGGDPVRAVTLAERACALTSHQMAPYLDTLAAAYAAAGRFNDAIAAAEKAIELARSAGQPQVASEIEAHLELYRAGRPYRLPRTEVRSQPLGATGRQHP